MNVKVNLDLGHKNDEQTCTDAEHYVASIGLTSNFTAVITPTMLTAIGTAVTAVRTARTALDAGTGGNNAASTLTQKLTALKKKITSIGLLVENTANDDAVPDVLRVGIVESAGMTVKGQVIPQKHHFGISQTVTAVVHVTAKGLPGGRGSHEWEFCIEPVASNKWLRADPTTEAETDIPNMIPGTTVAIRHRTVRSKKNGGISDWEVLTGFRVI